ncbi:MAG TPA: IPT/TIG domain-containing protein [Burkholderiaceae bacterium]|nr:IPT/TIG domain-containing protein [Burkholderiaceae bacterium]
MKRRNAYLFALVLICAVLGLVGCGGGSSGSTSTAAAPPAVTEILAANVPVGTEFTIKGINLDRVTGYQLGSISLQVVSHSATATTLKMPDQALSGVLTLMVGNASTPTAYQINVYVPISIAAITPQTGTAGTSVTISGNGLAAVNTVQFANGVTVSVQTQSDTSLTFTVPANAASGVLGFLSPYEQVTSSGTFSVTPETLAGSAGGSIATATVAGVDFVQVFDKNTNDTSLRLTPGRPALVRAAILATNGAVGNLNVNLSATLNGMPLGVLPMSGPAMLPSTQDIYDLASTFNAVLPGSWVQPGIRVRIDSALNGVPVASQSAAPRVGAATRLHLVLVPLTVNGVTGILPPIASVKQTLQRIYPYAADDIVVEARAPLTIADSAGSMTSSGWWSAALAQLEQQRQVEAPTRFYYGFAPNYNPLPSSFIAGLGYVNSMASAGVANVSAIGLDWAARAPQGDPFSYDWVQWQAIMVHEIGHNHSLNHAPCGNAGGVDPAYPYSGGGLGPQAIYNSLYSDTQLGMLSRPVLANNTGMKDLMGYCAGSWFSDYNYNLIQKFAEARTTAVPQPITLGTAADGYLTISGEIGPQGVLLHPALATSTSLVAPPAGKHAHMLRLHTVSGQTIELPFEPVSVADGADDLRHFSVSLPNPGQIDSVEILRNKQPQIMRQPSQAQRPAASGATQATAGGVSSKVRNHCLSVTWNAEAEPFLSIVHVAPDGTKTLVASELSKGSATLDIRALPSGGRFDLSLSSHIHARIVSITP